MVLKFDLTKRMEDQKSLEASTVISQLADTVQDKVNNLLANGVVATGVVIGSILLASHKLFRVEQLAVGSSTDFINNGGLKINKDSTGNMLASASFGEEGVEGVISTTDGLVRGHLAIRLDPVLQAVELPAGIAHLATGLADMDGDTFTL